MKSTIKLIFAAAVVALVACQKEIPTYNTDPEAVKLAATVGSPFSGSNPVDDAAGTALKMGDVIAISAGAQGKAKYTLGEGNALSPSTDKYLKWGDKAMTFNAYYPVGVNNASMAAFDLPADQSSLANIEQADYMTYTSAKPEAKAESINLTLTRKMLRVVIVPKLLDMYSGYTVEKVEVHSNTIGYADGTAKSGQTTIAPFKHTDNKYYALLSPTTADITTDFITLTVKKTADGTTETIPTTGIPDFEAGKSYTLDVEVGNNPMKIANTIVTDWTTGAVIPGDEDISKCDKWDGTYATTLASGAGTKESPYLIQTAEELALMSTYLYNQDSPINMAESYYKLMTNVDLDYKDWTPIGSGLYNGALLAGQNSFTGAFDGNGHTVRGLKVIASNDVAYVGLFGHASPFYDDLTIPAIQNLIIKDAIIYAGTTVVGNKKEFQGAGILAGSITGTGDVNMAIKNCHVTGTIYQVNNTDAMYVGGLVGYAQLSKFENCSANVTIDTKASCVGGLLGYVSASSSIKDSRSKGSIKGTWTMGGLAGGAQNSTTINNCTTSVDVTSYNWNVGGFVGYMNATITDCSASGDVTSTINWDNHFYKTGGFFGTNSGAAINCTYSGTLTYADSSDDSWMYYGAFTGYHDGGTTENCRFDGSKNPLLDKSGLSWMNPNPITGSNDISNTLK